MEFEQISVSQNGANGRRAKWTGRPAAERAGASESNAFTNLDPRKQRRWLADYMSVRHPPLCIRE